VYQNIAFALEIQKLPKQEIDQRIKEALAEVQMEGYENRYPREMSGGQQQRIALGRMLAYRPSVFLLDEPLSNLDARLRMDMRSEIKHLHHTAKATTVYVTHDQIEALTMSTKIAVMREGVLQQLDSPDNIYRYPANLFVADFIGNPKVNLLEGVVEGHGRVNLGAFSVVTDTRGSKGKVVLSIRPEDVSISMEEKPGAILFTAYSVLPSGADTTIVAKNGKIEVTVKEPGISKVQMEQRIWLTFNSEAINLYDKTTGNLIGFSR
jgi:multiple sugar transport system ATP-binding protein